MIVVSIRTHHQYKLALRRQVLHIGGTKNRAQQYKLALRQPATWVLYLCKYIYVFVCVCVCVCMYVCVHMCVGERERLI